MLDMYGIVDLSEASKVRQYSEKHKVNRPGFDKKPENRLDRSCRYLLKA